VRRGAAKAPPPLPAGALRWTLRGASLAAACRAGARPPRPGERPPAPIGQERALAALEVGLGIQERGFGVFVVGETGTGKTSIVREILAERARREPPGKDLVLLHNFEDRDRPHSVLLPAGEGPRIALVYAALVDRLVERLDEAFESEGYRASLRRIADQRSRRAEQAIAAIDRAARRRGFVLFRAGSAFTLAPAGEGGEPIADEEVAKLAPARRKALERAARALREDLERGLGRVREIERAAERAAERLAYGAADAVVSPLITAAKAECAGLPRVLAHLDAVRADILAHVDRQVRRGRSGGGGGGGGGGASAEAAAAAGGAAGGAAAGPDARGEGEAPATAAEEGGGEGGAGPAPRPHSALARAEEDEGQPPAARCRVHVLVTHPPSGGAPVVHETHPTTANLIGRIERRKEDETTSDPARIQAGSLYRANGGYLLLEALELLREPAAWDALKRALRNRAVELDDPGEPGRIVAAATLRPAPVPLSVKVVLIGAPEVYRALAFADRDFERLFKVKAEFASEVARTPATLARMARFLSNLARCESLPSLAPEGAARAIEEAARMAERGGKVSTRMGALADIVREAAFWARRERSETIERRHVRRALVARREREGLLEARLCEEIASGRVAVETRGAVAGQVNGLTVLDTGTYAFGAPARITCALAAGKGRIVDIERESALAGPFFTKGSLILRGLLDDRFGRAGPLRLRATIGLEQSYSEIDGDSASLAEACALFSALAGAPVAQRFAVTGSIDQRGRVQAVGGVNEKVEGFFAVAKARGLAGRPAVVIPRANAPDLALDEEVIAAARAGRFAVHAVATLEEALLLLTGRPWEGGSGALRPAIEATLERLARVTQAPPRAPARGAVRAPRRRGR
jgi:predicted ATP-dependent protease